MGIKVGNGFKVVKVTMETAQLIDYVFLFQEKPQEIVKGPLPAEHVIIQETFNGLVQRCKSMANNPVCINFIDFKSSHSSETAY